MDAGDIYSTLWNDTYDYLMGTSMACPFVSGLAALIFSKNPSWTNDMVRNAVENSTDPIDNKNPGYEGLLGKGRINALNAINYTPDTTPPTGAPSTPTDGGDSSTSPAITFTWTQGTAADPESGITGYYLQVGTTAGGNDKFDGAVGNVLTKIITGCEGGKTYFARVKAKNGSGLYSGWSGNSDGIIINLPSLGEALDNTSLTWTTGGNASWTGQTAVSFFGGDAAESGDIADSQSAYLQTTVTGPGTLSFYWKVSSESGYDYLKFYIDDVAQSGSISGEVTWELKSYTLASGSHTVKWEYTKDGSVSDGSDAAWVDKVEVGPPDTTPPSAVSNLATGTATSVSISLTWTAVGDDGSTGTATSYDIRYSTATITDANWDTATQVTGEPAPKAAGGSETFAVSGLEPGTTFYFAVKVADEAQNFSGISNVASGSTLPGVALGEAVDNTALTFTAGGSAVWFGQDAVYYFGNDAAQSGDIADSQSTYLQTTVTGPVTLSFYWKVSSESGYDKLKFYIDGVLQSGSISGEVTWQLKSYTLASGSHTVKWEYTKDYSISNGSDAGWVDKVQVGAGDTTKPQITNTVPGQGAANISAAQSMVVTFSEPMTTSSVAYTSTPDPGGWSVTWSGNDTVVTFSHTSFADGTSYTFQVTSATDVAGNALEAGSVPNPFSFTTGAPVSVPWTDSMENEINGWSATGFWHQVKDGVNPYPNSHSPVTSWWYGQDSTGDYNNGASNNGGLTTPRIDLTGISAVSLSFWYWYETETSLATIRKMDAGKDISGIKTVYDKRLVQVSEDGTTWSTLAQISADTMKTWLQKTIGIPSSYLGKKIYIRFYFDTDDDVFNTYRGWYVDDVSVKADTTKPQITGTTPANGAANVSAAQSVVVTFSESIDTTTVTYTSAPDPGGWNVTWNSDKTTATFSHTAFTAGTTYAFQITSAKDLAGNTLDAGTVPNPFSFTIINVVTATFSSGVSMVAIPIDAVDKKATSVLGLSSGFDLAKWVQAEGKYHYYSQTPSDTLLQFYGGQGYFLKLTSGKTVSVSGSHAPTNADYVISLKAGWNQIANPFNFNVKFSDVKVKYQNATKTLTEAANAGWIGKYAISYPSQTAGYQLVHPTATGAKRNLEPWLGYWVNSAYDLELLIPPTPAVQAKENVSGGSFGLMITAVSGDYTSGVVVGEGAKAESVPKPPSPISEGVEIYLSLGGGRYMAEFKDGMSIMEGGEKIWEFTVEVSLKGAPATLSWDVLSLPEGLNVLLEDVEGRNTVSMVNTKTYSFKTDYLAVRHFKVRAGKNLSFGPLKLGGVKNFPNPSRNPHTKFFYKPESGQLTSATIELYTLSGKLVVKILDPTPADGEYLYDIPQGIANGVYLYRITVTDGKETVARTGKMVILR